MLLFFQFFTIYMQSIGCGAKNDPVYNSTCFVNTTNTIHHGNKEKCGDIENNLSQNTYYCSRFTIICRRKPNHRAIKIKSRADNFQLRSSSGYEELWNEGARIFSFLESIFRLIFLKGLYLIILRYLRHSGTV